VGGGDEDARYDLGKADEYGKFGLEEKDGHALMWRHKAAD
jgi:hypothetical protein